MRLSIFGGLFLTFGLVYEINCQNEINTIARPCPVPGTGQIIADTESRSIYWMCLSNGPTLMRCPYQFIFNPNTGRCEKDSFECIENGRFPDPLDCRAFHQCTWIGSSFVDRITTCPVNTHYDQQTLNCAVGPCPSTTPPPSRPPKVIFETFNVGYMTAYPDGVIVDHVLTTNENFPGINLRAKLGDTLHITVINNITDENGNHPHTTIHWHGLVLQKGLIVYDGPEGVTQCGISHNNSMEYNIPLMQAGTYWWHSHVGTQYTEGLLGSLIIEDDNDPYLGQYDYDNLVFTLGDWYHTPANPNLASYQTSGAMPSPDSALINGHGTFPCSETTRRCIQLQPRIYEVNPGARYRIRVINVSTFWMFKFYIEGHSLEIIEVDGVMTKKTPPCDYIIMSSGQRYSIIVTMNAESSSANRDFLIHAENANGNSGVGAKTSAILRYTDVYRNPRGFVKTDSELTEYEPVALDERLLVPYDDNEVAPAHYDEYKYLQVTSKVANGINHLTFNDVIFETEGAPLLYRMINELPIPSGANPQNITYGKVVEVELYNANPRPHPFHLHGHTFWVMASGPANSGRMKYPYPKPIRRDTVTAEGNSTVVFRFVADNPGAWLFHCHINWHHLVGLAAVFIEGHEEARTQLRYPEWGRELCIQSGEIMP